MAQPDGAKTASGFAMVAARGQGESLKGMVGPVERAIVPSVPKAALGFGLQDFVQAEFVAWRKRHIGESA